MKAMLLLALSVVLLPGCCGWWKCKKKCEPNEVVYEKSSMSKQKMRDDRNMK